MLSGVKKKKTVIFVIMTFISVNSKVDFVRYLNNDYDSISNLTFNVK